MPRLPGGVFRFGTPVLPRGVRETRAPLIRCLPGRWHGGCISHAPWRVPPDTDPHEEHIMDKRILLTGAGGPAAISFIKALDGQGVDIHVADMEP